MAVDYFFQQDQISTLISVALVTLITIFGIIRITQFLTLFKQFQGYPGVPSYSILFGNLHKLPSTGEGRIAFGRNILESYNPKYSRFWLGPFRPVLNFFHPETAKQVLKSSAPKDRTFGGVYNLIQPWIGNGLITSNGHTWARSRRLLTPAFHFDILRSYMGIYNKSAETLMKKMDIFADSGDMFNICPLMTLCTLEVILKCAMNYDIDLQNIGHHPYAQACVELGKTFAERARAPYLWPDLIFLLTSKGRKFLKNCRYVHKVAEEVISKRKMSMDDQGKGRHLDFLDTLLSARDEDGNPMTTEEIRSEVDTFMFAGHDTTAAASSWILYCFAKYPEYQRKVQVELDSLLENRDTDDILWSDLSKLETLALCIKEAMRLFPPVPFIQRMLNEPVEVDGKVLPAGFTCTISIIHLHRNPLVWENPDDFYPERFLPENSKTRDNFAFIPFSAGSRNCIGQAFALNEEKVLISRILRRYDIELATDGPTVQRSPEAVLKTDNGIWFTLVKRKL